MIVTLSSQVLLLINILRLFSCSHFLEHDMKQSRHWFVDIFQRAFSFHRKNGRPHQAALWWCAKRRATKNVWSLVCLKVTVSFSLSTLLFYTLLLGLQLAGHRYRMGGGESFRKWESDVWELRPTVCTFQTLHRICSCGQWATAKFSLSHLCWDRSSETATPFSFHQVQEVKLLPRKPAFLPPISVMSVNLTLAPDNKGWNPPHNS